MKFFTDLTIKYQQYLTFHHIVRINEFNVIYFVSNIPKPKHFGLIAISSIATSPFCDINFRASNCK